MVMGIWALSSTGVSLPVGGRWLIEVATADDDGYAVDAAPTVTITLPAGSTTSPTLALVTTGHYRTSYEVGTAGRYVARVVAAGYGAVDLTAYVAAVTAGTGMPDVDDVINYLGPTSHAEEALQDALDAEAAAQRSVCRVRAVYPPDLRQALLRRVARNLAMRQLPLAVPQGDAEAGPMILPGRDPEVRRLEAPHRRLAVG